MVNYEIVPTRAVITTAVVFANSVFKGIANFRRFEAFVDISADSIFPYSTFGTGDLSTVFYMAFVALCTDALISFISS